MKKQTYSPFFSFLVLIQNIAYVDEGVSIGNVPFLGQLTTELLHTRVRAHSQCYVLNA